MTRVAQRRDAISTAPDVDAGTPFRGPDVDAGRAIVSAVIAAAPISLTEGPDSFYQGTAGDDVVYLLGGDDFYNDSDGNDAAYGGSGADGFDDVAGNDLYAGGWGNDLYIFTEATNTFIGQDRIEEEGGDDLIELQYFSPNHVRLERDGDDLVVVVRDELYGVGDEASLRVADHFIVQDGARPFAVERLDLVAFDNSRTVIDLIDLLPQPIRLGDAPTRFNRGEPDAWATAWTSPRVGITHKADASDATTPWSAVDFGTIGPNILAGTDIDRGDLGVSGTTVASGDRPQEIDGTEGLRFEFALNPQSQITFTFASLEADEGAAGVYESGRITAYGKTGGIVASWTFSAATLTGSLTVESTQPIAAFDLEAGAYDNAFVWQPGAYTDADGDFGGLADPATGLGSGYLVDSVVLEPGIFIA